MKENLQYNNYNERIKEYLFSDLVNVSHSFFGYKYGHRASDLTK